jgi:anti-sigma-K factor RskA
LIVGVGGYLTWNFAVEHAKDVSKIQGLEASLQEQSTRFSSLQRQLDAQTRALAELRTEVQQRINETAEAQEQLAQRETELEETRMQLSRRGGARTARAPQDELAALLRRPDVQAITLTGSDMAKRAVGFLLYDPQTHKIWLYSVNLPECPSGTTYQLWAIAGKPVSIGTFQMGRGETAHLLVKNVSKFTGANTFTVSLEPSGGRPQPTGPMYLLSRS